MQLSVLLVNYSFLRRMLNIKTTNVARSNRLSKLTIYFLSYILIVDELLTTSWWGMGRKSLKTQRTTQILEAFERCIVKYGFPASTLEKIADEAGVSRSILRHYIGNREDIIRELILRYTKKYQESLLSRVSSIPETDHVKAFIDFYFEGWFEFGRDGDTIFGELISASERDKKLRNLMLNVYQTFEAKITNFLCQRYPHASEDRCRTVAYAVMCLSYGHSEMWWLGFDLSRYPDLKRVIRSLMDTLANENVDEK